MTGFPGNGTVLFQDVSCNGTEFSPSECPYQPATNPQCFIDNSTAGVRCTEGELGNTCLWDGLHKAVLFVSTFYGSFLTILCALLMPRLAPLGGLI